MKFALDEVSLFVLAGSFFGVFLNGPCFEGGYGIELLN
jgi:hypothetical protein